MKIIQDFETATDIVPIEVKSAFYLGGHTIKVVFTDGIEQAIDFSVFLSKSLHPSISKYLNEDLFQKFQLVDGNLNWNDYDLIFPIEDLYKGEIS
ncbi:MAG TPA: DUF2442 domain-containing protein [Mucilaginibacter sp.]|jgi:hypothetical protein|nr:DUF2442 domain-containing protein [Mucilaginibacter sp.]